MKAVKITTTGITQVDNLLDDKDYTNSIQSNLYLDIPSRWQHNKYHVSLICKDVFSDDNKLNHLATHILTSCSKYHANDIVCGTVFLINEDHDMVIDGLKYINNHIGK